MNVLSYTSLSTSPCKESLNIPEGSSCISSKSIKKLEKKEKSMNKNKDPNQLIPTIIDEDLLPSDGSKESNMIRRLAASLNCSSERCILSKNLLEKKETEKELKRLKTKGPRLLNTGTHGEIHAYNVLLEWAEIFDFFQPLPHVIIKETDDISTINKKISISKIMKIINNDFPDVRVIALDMTLEIKTSDLCSGWHAIVLLIDIRGDTFEEWTIEYFDSSGYPPNSYISSVMENLKEEIKKYRTKKKHTGGVDTAIVTERLKQQTTSTECGPISLIYIRRRLEGISYKAFSKYKISEDFAKSFRQFIFTV